MSLVSSVQSKKLTKSFALDIPNFAIQAEAISKSYRVILSPDFFFDGLANENYKGNINVRYSDGHYNNARERCSSALNFAVQLSTSGGLTPPGLPMLDIASTISVSIYDATSGGILTLGEKTETKNSIPKSGSTFSAMMTKPLAELKKSCRDPDEVRVSVRLTLLYTSNKDNGWKLENSLAHFSRKNIPARPSYDEPLAKRKKTDLTVECAGREFTVHSLVLKLVSPVFERMLEANMEEAASRRITIDDVEPEAIERMVNFIYTGKLLSEEDQPSDESIIQLLHCAEKYEIADMKLEVLNQICCRLTATNAIRYVEAIKTYDGDMVLPKVLDFCKKNLAHFRKDPEFEKFLLENMQALI